MCQYYRVCKNAKRLIYSRSKQQSVNHRYTKISPSWHGIGEILYFVFLNVSTNSTSISTLSLVMARLVDKQIEAVFKEK